MQGVTLPLDTVKLLLEYFDADKPGGCLYCGGLTGHMPQCPGQVIRVALRRRDSHIEAKRKVKALAGI